MIQQDPSDVDPAILRGDMKRLQRVPIGIGIGATLQQRLRIVRGNPFEQALGQAAGLLRFCNLGRGLFPPAKPFDPKQRRTLVLKRGKERVIANRHPWIFAGAIHTERGPEDAAIGDLVRQPT